MESHGKRPSSVPYNSDNKDAASHYFSLKPVKLNSISRISIFANVHLKTKKQQQSSNFLCAKLFQSAALLAMSQLLNSTTNFSFLFNFRFSIVIDWRIRE